MANRRASFAWPMPSRSPLPTWEPIPQDATFALAFRLSPPQAFDIFRSIVEKVDPPAKERIAAGLAAVENHLDLKLEDDVLQPLGDTWRMFDSPSEGGVFTGLTLVVSLKDAQRAAATHAKLLKLWPRPSSEEDDLAMYRPGPPRLETQEFAGKQIYSVDLGPRRAFMAPAWCMTEKELIVALFPQSIKAYLSRPAGFKSLAQTAEVAQAFQGETGPLKLAYCDSRRVFDILYPMVSVWTRALAATQRRLGVDLGAMMPSARAIRGHLSPAVTTVR